MKVLAILVTYNAMRWIDRCLESLLTSSVQPDIFIKDNGSTDRTVDYIRSNYKNSKLLLTGGGVI